MNRFLRSLVFLATISAAGVAQAVCPSGTHSLGVVDGKERCALRGKYLSADVTLTADKEYILEGGVPPCAFRLER